MPAGRPEAVTDDAIALVKRERQLGHSYREIARRLCDAGVEPPGGGQRWWPSVVREAALRHG